MHRFATLLLLAAGCSVELQGLDTQGIVMGDGDDSDDLLDAQILSDSSAPADSATPERDAAAEQDANVIDDAGTSSDSDGGTPPIVGYQPPAGQIGARCGTALDCQGSVGFHGETCAKTAQPPIGSDTGYCTRSCTNVGPGAAACGQDSICVTVNGAGTCQRTCGKDSDCRIEDGYYCASMFPLLHKVCWHH